MPLHGEIVVIKRNGTDGTHFPLTATACLFGRKAECDIRIQLPHVSKEHCKVEVKEKGEVYVTNLSTVNPAQLNGTAIKHPVRLKYGDVITIIDRSFRFEKPQAQQGRRRSTGLESATYKAFSSTQSSDTNETVRFDELITSKSQRKSEGNLSKTTPTRRSLHVSSPSPARKDLSPFGELYEMLKTKVESQKKKVKSPVKDDGSSPKSVTTKRYSQAEENLQSPFSRRKSRRSQSSDRSTTQSKEVDVQHRSLSSTGVRESSKGPRVSLTKQTHGKAMETASPTTSDKEVQNNSSQGESVQKPIQTPRRSSNKRNSQSESLELETPNSNVTSEKRSPRRSASAEQVHVIAQVLSPVNSKASDSPIHRRRSGLPVQHVLNHPDGSPLPNKSPTRGRRSASKDQAAKGTPTKPVVAEDKASEPVAAEKRKSPKKRRSDELSLPEPPFKRKRVSFGGHLSPELFDKRLPPNSPLKKGATPARRSLSINSPRAVIRKSFGLKQSMIKEVFEQSLMQSASSSTRRRSPASSPAKSSLPARSPAATKTERSPTTKSPVSPARPPAATRSPVRRTPGTEKKSPTTSLSTSPVTPVKKSPKKSPVRTPSTVSVKKTSFKPFLSTKSPVKSPSLTPSKRAHVKSPSEGSPVKSLFIDSVTKSTTASPGKSLSAAVSPIQAKRSPAAKSPSLNTAKRTPVKSPKKQLPVKSLFTAPARKSATSRKESPAAQSPSMTRRSPAAQSPSMTTAWRTPVNYANKGSSVKSLPTTPARKSTTATPRKMSPAVKRSPASSKTSPATKSPRKLSPATPYTKGRFSVSRIDTPPQVLEQVESEFFTSHTPKHTRKSLRGKKTPLRSRKLEAFEMIRSRRRSGATEANLLVAKSWADVVKIGIAKHQKKSDKPVQKVIVIKKKLKLKTPVKATKNQSSTGHADSPATILVGRAYTRTVNLTGHVPKVVRNQALKLNTGYDESFTGMAELFSTPANKKQRRSSRIEVAKADTPKSLIVEMSMRTPEESGEMVVSPLNSSATIQRKQYSHDAVSRLLQSSPELSKRSSVTSKNVGEEISKSLKEKLKYVGLSGIKRIMKTPKQKGKPITDPHALKKLLRTPKEAGSLKTYTRRSTKLEVLGIDRLLKTPKQKGEPVEDLVGIKRIMRTPQERVQPVEDMIGIKRIMRTPKEKGQIVEDIDISHLMSTPPENAQSANNTRPIEEIFGIRNLIKTPPKKSVVEQAVSTDPTNDQSTKVVGSSSTPGRGRSSKRLTLPAETATSAEVSKESIPIYVEVTSPTSRGRPRSKSEEPKESVPVSDSEVTSPTRRGRPRSLAEVPKESVSIAVDEVTSPTSRGRSRSMATVSKQSIPVSVEVTSTSRERHRSMAAISKESIPVSVAVTSTSRGKHRSMAAISKESIPVSVEVTSTSRGRPRSKSEEPKESVPVSDSEVTSPTRRGRPRSLAEVPKESVSIAVDEVTSPTSRGRSRSMAAVSKQSIPVSVEVTSTSRGRHRSMAAVSKESILVSVEVSSTSRGRHRSEAKEPEKSVPVPDSEVTSPTRRGRSRSSAELPKESVSVADGEVTSPSHRGKHRSTVDIPKESVPDSEVTSPTHRGKPGTAEVHKESVPVSDGELTSQSQSGRPKRETDLSKESVSVTSATRGRRSRVTAEVPQESVPVTEVVTSPTRGRRSKITAAVSQESVPVTEVVTSPKLGRRSKITADVPQESVPVTEVVTSPTRGRRSKITADIPQESVPVTEMVTSPTRGRRSKITADIPQESVPVTEMVTSPTRGRRSKGTADVPQEFVPEVVTSPTRGRKSKTTADVSQESCPVTEVTSPILGRRSKGTADVPQESVPVTEVVTSPTLGHRSKITADVPQESVPVTEVVTSPTRGRRSKGTADVPQESVPVTEVVTSPTRGRRSKGTADVPQESVPVTDVVTSPTLGRRSKITADVSQESFPVTEVTSPTRERRSKGTADVPLESVPVTEVVTSPTRGRRRKVTADVPQESVPVAEVVTSPTRGRRSKITADVAQESVPVTDVVTSPTRGRKVTADVPQESVPVTEVVTSPTRGRRSKGTADVPQESVPVTEVVTSPTRGRRSKGTADVPQESVPVTEVVTSPTLGPRSKITADVSQESFPVTEVTSPTRGHRSKGTADVPLESVPVTEVVTSPTRGRRRKVTADVPQESVPVTEVVTSPTRGRRSKITADVPQESVPVAEVVTSLTLGRRSKITADVPQESVPVTEVVTSPTRGRRSKGTADVPQESVPVTEVVTSPTLGRRSKITADVSQESFPVTEVVTSPTRGRRRKVTADVPKESVPVAEVVTSPTRGRRSKGTADVPQESVPVTEVVTSPTLGRRSKITADVSQESFPVTEVTSPTRGHRSKGTADVPLESVPVTEVVTSPTRGRRRKVTADVPQESVPVAEVVSSPTRGRRSKITADVPQESVPVAEVVTSPTRGRRSKINADVPQESVPVTDVVTSPTRGRRRKVTTDVPQESVPVATVVTSSTRGRRRKVTTDVPQESVPVATVVTSSIRGRRRKVTTDVPQESVPVADELTTSQRGRPINTVEIPKEFLPVSEGEMTSPKKKGPVKTTQGKQNKATLAPKPKASENMKELHKEALHESGTSESETSLLQGRPKGNLTDQSASTLKAVEVTDLPQETLEDENDKIAAKSSKKTGRRNVKNLKPSRQNVDEQSKVPELLQPEESTALAVETHTKLSAPSNRRGKVTHNGHPSTEVSRKPQSSLGDAQPDELSVKSSLVPRRGGRRKYVEKQSSDVNLNVSKLEEPQQEIRRGGLSKSKSSNSAKENTDSNVLLKSKSPEPKSLKRSTRHQKHVLPEVSAEMQSKSLRGRQNRNPLKANATETSNSDNSGNVDASKKETPIKGRSSAAKVTSNVSISDADEQEKPESSASAAKQRGRRNKTLQESSNPSQEDQPKHKTIEETETSTRARRGKKNVSESDKLQPVSEVKGKKSARSKTLQTSDEQNIHVEKSFKTKSVQWYPLVATEGNTIKDKATAQDTNTEVPPCGGRSKGKMRLDAPESVVPAKRSRRENLANAKDILEPSSIPETKYVSITSVAEDIPVKGKRGRRGTNSQEKISTSDVPERDTDTKTAEKSTSKPVPETNEVVPKRNTSRRMLKAVDSSLITQSASSVESSEHVHKNTSSHTHGRRGAASKALDSINNEVYGIAEVLSTRGRRGAATSKTPAENKKSPVKPKRQRTGASPKGGEEAAESSATSTRRLKRKMANTEATSGPLEDHESYSHESNLAETENIPISRKKNARNTKTQKGEAHDELQTEKQLATANSPAKRSKTEAAITAAQKKGKSGEASKRQNERPAVVVKTRTSARSRK